MAKDDSSVKVPALLSVGSKVSIFHYRNVETGFFLMLEVELTLNENFLAASRR